MKKFPRNSLEYFLCYQPLCFVEKPLLLDIHVFANWCLYKMKIKKKRDAKKRKNMHTIPGPFLGKKFPYMNSKDSDHPLHWQSSHGLH